MNPRHVARNFFIFKLVNPIDGGVSTSEISVSFLRIHGAVSHKTVSVAVLRPYFVQNKYVIHTNISRPPEDQERPPGGALQFESLWVSG
jgi:hypothetical protein